METSGLAHLVADSIVMSHILTGSLDTNMTPMIHKA